MTTVIAFVSQKGGVGKSTLARALTREAAASGLRVKIADLDPDQATIIDWHKVRTQRAIEPMLSVELFRTASQALAGADGYDLLVIDGPAKASGSTTEIAKRATLSFNPPERPGMTSIRPFGCFMGWSSSGCRMAAWSLLSTTLGRTAKLRPPAPTLLRRDIPPCPATCRSDQPTESPRMTASL